jgi:hypothetical protein
MKIKHWHFYLVWHIVNTSNFDIGTFHVDNGTLPKHQIYSMAQGGAPFGTIKLGMAHQNCMKSVNGTFQILALGRLKLYTP